ncbi:MAG: iron hydrogenase small subunit, partial [Lentisphaeria bacterium]
AMEADAKAKRMKGIYQADHDLPLRKSHENPSVAALYEQFLGKPLGHLSHELLHTRYTVRGTRKFPAPKT